MLVFILGGIAAIGSGLVLAAAWASWRFGARLGAAPLGRAEPVSLLKPLHGAEPQLRANLQSFLDQDWAAPITLVAGIQRESDPAAEAVAALATGDDRRAVLVADARRHGANAKVGNLINMAPAADADLIVLSDSDIAAPRDYLSCIAGALATPGVGAVTCAYAGRGDGGFWSLLGAAMLSYQFLPSVLFADALGTGDACMGSTIALRREMLTRIGGFEAFADILADDHAIGAAVRAQGLQVALAPVIVTHGSVEPSLPALLRHELRWAATVRDLNPGRMLGMTLLHPLPFALAALALAPGWATGALVALAIGTRLTVAAVVDGLTGRKTAPWLLLPLRDLLTFGVHVSCFFVRRVEWQGARLAMREAGRIEAQ
ncbi:MAG: hypothetical protein A4S16_12235 [Proteobacteria bacterium SG_bin6]|nr:MAG: hypothetical protein A4S16_12235 [Proteobacteria bacterium SG_bin6]